MKLDTTNIIETKLVPAVQNADTILLCTHIRPDGDAIGSLTAMGCILRGLGKNVTLFSHDDVPSKFLFLSLANEVVNTLSPNAAPFDLAVALDVAEETRMGDALQTYKQSKITAQLDHHGTNPGYADINIIDIEASSTGNMVLWVSKVLGLPLTKDCALCLYTAISSDTGNFCFSNTNQDTFLDTAVLMRAGLDIGIAARKVHLVHQKPHVLLLGCALRSIRFLADGQISGMFLRTDDFTACGAVHEHSDKIVNHGLDIDGVKIAYLAEEVENGIKFSLRSILPYSISDVAVRFGGGGHLLAAGCLINDTPENAIAAVENELIKRIIKA